MILKGNERGGGKQLAIHLLKPENEHVDVHDVRGFVSDDLTSAMYESYAISRGTRCQKFLFSMSLNPPENESVPVEIFEDAIARIEKKLGLEGQPRAIVFHEKEGRRHAHVVWSRIDAIEMKAINLPHYKLKLMDISRDLYLEHGWKMPEGLMNSEARDPLNFTQGQWQQARRARNDPRTLKAMFQECWAVSDSKKAFAQALKARGFHLARGDRRGYVAMDFRGEIYAVAKWTGLKAKDVKARLGDPKELPSLAETKVMIADSINERLRAYISETETAFQKNGAQLAFRKAEMVQRHREERTRLKAGQAKRWAQETQARAARMSGGIRGIWDRLTGKYSRQRNRNEAETYQALRRDGSQKQDLIDAQIKERRVLQKDIHRLRQAHTKAVMRLHRDVAHYMGMKQPDPTIGKGPAQARHRRSGPSLGL